MTRNKKDNPAMLGLMGVILIGALFSVGKSLFSGDGAAPAAKAPAAASDSAPDVSAAPIGVLPVSMRDPFSSTLYGKMARLHAGGGPAAPAALIPVPTVRSRPRGVPAPVLNPVAPSFRAAPITVRGTGDAAAARIAAEEDSLVRAFRVTAIVMGASPYAVLEAQGGPPHALHKAEAYHSLRLVDVRPAEIVIRGQSGIWTLPLATPDSEAPAADARN